MTGGMELLFGPPPFLVACLGSKHAGKSIVIRHVCYSYRKHFSKIVVISSTSFNSAYDFCPDKYVHSAYDPEIVQGLLDEGRRNREAGRERHVLLVLDDVIGAIDFRKPAANPELQKLWSSNRHYHVSVIVASQTPKGVPPLVRQNCDFATIHKSLMSAMNTLWEDFGTMAKRPFVEFLLENTLDYNFVVFSAREHGADKLRVLKIPPAFLKHKFRLVY